MSRVKCYSVRLQSLQSISDKAYRATDFSGKTAIIPKSQVFGFDFDTQKSEAYWISAWILERKEITYSTKKESWFDKIMTNVVKTTLVNKPTKPKRNARITEKEGVIIERFIPPKMGLSNAEPDSDLMR